MLFFPVGVTAITTSTLLPQRVQSFAKFLAPVLAETSVLDFPDMIIFSFQNLYSLMGDLTKIPSTFDMRTIPF